MKHTPKLVLTMLGAVVLVACSQESHDAPQRAVQGVISDAVHGDMAARVAGFYFLPPMVANPSPTGVFEPAVGPTVRIDRLGTGSGPIAAFTPTTGPDGELVRVLDGQYHVNWHTDRFGLDPALTYRIRVLAPLSAACPSTRTVAGVGCELGYADVAVAGSSRELRNVQTNEYIPLVNGRTLPVQFRIERAAVDGDGDGVLDWRDNCPIDANADQADSVASDNGSATNPGDACRCRAVTCRALDQCHAVGVCSPTTGLCSNPEQPNGTRCNDNNACTRADTCQAGVCTGADPVTCTARDACHVAGTCDPATGVCSDPNASDGTTCNDGNACTRADTCAAGVCTGNDPVACTARDACHAVGVCDTATGQCSNPPQPTGTSCADGTVCNGAETCDGAGTCRAGTAPVVDDGNPCTADACDAVAGVTHTAVAAGVSCSNGNACDGAETCDGSGFCAPGRPPVVDDGNACTTDRCDPAVGVLHAPVVAGTSCSDFNACNGAETCDGVGACRAGTAPATDDGNACTVDACDPMFGVVHNPAPAGTACPDGNACNGAETCDSAGACRYGPLPVVDDANPCTTDACNPATGVSHTPVAVGASCSDGDVCNGAETCGSTGICTPGTPPVVDDGNPCTTDSCEPEGGVFHALIAGCVTNALDGGVLDGGSGADAGPIDAGLCRFAGPFSAEGIQSILQPCYDNLTRAALTDTGDDDAAMVAFETCVNFALECGMGSDGGVPQTSPDGSVASLAVPTTQNTPHENSVKPPCATRSADRTTVCKLTATSPAPRGLFTRPRRTPDTNPGGIRPSSSDREGISLATSVDSGGACTSQQESELRRCFDEKYLTFLGSMSFCTAILVAGGISGGSLTTVALISFGNCSRSAYNTYISALAQCRRDAGCSSRQNCTNGVCCPLGHIGCNGRCVPQRETQCAGGGEVFDTNLCRCRCPSDTTLNNGICCPSGRIGCRAPPVYADQCVSCSVSGMTVDESCNCVCPAGQVPCQGTCVNLGTIENCHHCGHRCENGTQCIAGQCVCGPGETFCGGRCVNSNCPTATEFDLISCTCRCPRRSPPFDLPYCNGSTNMLNTPLEQPVDGMCETVTDCSLAVTNGVCRYTSIGGATSSGAACVDACAGVTCPTGTRVSCSGPTKQTYASRCDRGSCVWDRLVEFIHCSDPALGGMSGGTCDVINGVPQCVGPR